MRGSRSRRGVKVGKESESTSVIVDGESMCADLKDVIDRHSRSVDEPHSDRRGDGHVNA
jgi:hypothetical protein